jgi:hypothetical protein
MQLRVQMHLKIKYKIIDGIASNYIFSIEDIILTIRQQ